MFSDSEVSFGIFINAVACLVALHAKVNISLIEKITAFVVLYADLRNFEKDLKKITASFFGDSRPETHVPGFIIDARDML